MICKKNILKKCIGYILLMASVMVLILMSFQTVTDDIWYDEVFSLSFVKGSFADIIKYTARDVHPPFYYFYLKMMISIIQLVPGMSFVTACKLASVLPAIGLLVICVSYIRKSFGELVMGASAFLLITMPEIGNYYVEIRMYSLALLLITAAGLFALSIIRERDTIIKWICLFILGILTAYTQYYACIGIIGVYVALMIMILIGSKDTRRRRLFAFGVCGCLSVVLYIPWIPVVISQINNIRGVYWIQPLTIRSIAGCIKFITMPVAPYGKFCLVAAALLILSISLIFIWNIACKRDRELISILLIGFVPIFVIIVSGFVFSIIGTPIFVYRYMVPALGLMWISVAILFDRMTEAKTICIMLIIAFVFTGILSVRGFYLEEHKKVLFMKDTVTALEKIEDDAVVICNFDHVASVIGYRMDNNVYLYEGEIDRLIPDMLHGTGEFIDDAGVLQLVNDYSNVYFFGSFNSRDEILDNWSALGINNMEQDSVLMERYWFNIYRLGMD